MMERLCGRRDRDLQLANFLDCKVNRSHNIDEKSSDDLFSCVSVQS